MTCKCHCPLVYSMFVSTSPFFTVQLSRSDWWFEKDCLRNAIVTSCNDEGELEFWLPSPTNALWNMWLRWGCLAKPGMPSLKVSIKGWYKLPPKFYCLIVAAVPVKVTYVALYSSKGGPGWTVLRVDVKVDPLWTANCRVDLTSWLSTKQSFVLTKDFPTIFQNVLTPRPMIWVIRRQIMSHLIDFTSPVLPKCIATTSLPKGPKLTYENPPKPKNQIES